MSPRLWTRCSRSCLSGTTVRVYCMPPFSRRLRMATGRLASRRPRPAALTPTLPDRPANPCPSGCVSVCLACIAVARDRQALLRRYVDDSPAPSWSSLPVHWHFLIKHMGHMAHARGGQAHQAAGPVTPVARQGSTRDAFCAVYRSQLVPWSIISRWQVWDSLSNDRTRPTRHWHRQWQSGTTTEGYRCVPQHQHFANTSAPAYLHPS